MKMDVLQTIKRLFAGEKEMKAKIMADVKAWYEMRERGEAEGKAYIEKLLSNGKPTE
jgi:hypothetical protein